MRTSCVCVVRLEGAMSDIKGCEGVPTTFTTNKLLIRALLDLRHESALSKL